MDDDKIQMKKDLALILKIDKKMNYSDIGNVQKIHDEIVQKDLFQTALGTRYVRKLEKIATGTSTNQCLFCGKSIPKPNNTVLCDECLKKFTKPTNQNLHTASNTSVHETTQTNNNGEKGNKATFAEEQAESSPKKSLKNVFIGIAALFIVFSIISAIGIGKIFSAMTIVALIVLIYEIVKKKPKKVTGIVLVVLIVLTAIFSNDSSNNSSNLKGYDAFEKFVRNNENEGKTITFDAEVVSVFNDKYLIQVRKKNSSKLIQIITTPVSGLELFHGDSISYTGIYNGRTTDGNRIAFVTKSIKVK